MDYVKCEKQSFQASSKQRHSMAHHLGSPVATVSSPFLEYGIPINSVHGVSTCLQRYTISYHFGKKINLLQGFVHGGRLRVHSSSWPPSTFLPRFRCNFSLLLRTFFRHSSASSLENTLALRYIEVIKKFLMNRRPGVLDSPRSWSSKGIIGVQFIAGSTYRNTIQQVHHFRDRATLSALFSLLEVLVSATKLIPRGSWTEGKIMSLRVRGREESLQKSPRLWKGLPVGNRSRGSSINPPPSLCFHLCSVNGCLDAPAFAIISEHSLWIIVAFVSTKLSWFFTTINAISLLITGVIE